MKVCLVTGASSGIGRATALELLRAGHTVYGAARRVERMEPLREAGGHVIGMDVTKDPDVERAVQTVVDEQGRIDVLVNNAGIGLYGAAEDVPIDRVREEFEVNLFGPARLAQLVLPHLRAQRSGTIVNVSSMGGAIALPLGAWYHASKHALEAYSDSLRQEVGRFGVRVVIIQPGLVQTEFQDHTSDDLREFSGQGAYRDLVDGMASKTDSSFGAESKASDPAVIAKAIREAVEAPKPKIRYAVGYLAKPVILMRKLVTDRAWDKVVTRR